MIPTLALNSFIGDSGCDLTYVLRFQVACLLCDLTSLQLRFGDVGILGDPERFCSLVASAWSVVGTGTMQAYGRADWEADVLFGCMYLQTWCARQSPKLQIRRAALSRRTQTGHSKSNRSSNSSSSSSSSLFSGGSGSRSSALSL